MILMLFTGIVLIRCYWSRFCWDLRFHAGVAVHTDALVLHHSAQSSSCHVLIGQRAQLEQGMGILGQATVTRLGGLIQWLVAPSFSCVKSCAHGVTRRMASVRPL